MNGWRPAAAAAVVVLGVYVGLAFLNSPRGFLGTDTGGKVATLKVMSERGRFDPDVGYWAERWDPTGSLHPLAFTSHTSSGGWVNVTTLPALWVGWELYRIGGYRLALLVPMAGSLAAAFAGLALLRRLGVRSDRWAWGGFLVLALASPLTIYALDFWEHSLGVALMAWAVVLLVDARGAPSRGWWWRLAGAGMLFGAAATMRTEALVYLAVAAVAFAFYARSTGDGPAERAQIVKAAIGAAMVVAAAAVPLVVNEVVERHVVGSTIRASRVVGTAVAVGDLPGNRLREAAITLFGLEASALGIALGVLFVGLLVLAAVRRRADTGLAVVATAAAGAILLVRAVAGGLGFVPGLATAWVLPASGFVNVQAGIPASPFTKPRRFVFAVAVGAVPIVLVTQLRGGAAPQWAGRYLLTSGFLLAVLGWADLASTAKPAPAVALAVAALAVAVTTFGLAWMSVRTHDVERTVAALERRSEPVIVSDVLHLAREGGATYGDKRWLTLTSGSKDTPKAAQVAAAAGVDAFASVQQTGSPALHFPGFHSIDHTMLRLFDGVDLRVTSWRIDAT